MAHDLEDEVDLAVEHMAFADLGQRVHMLFKGAQISLGLAFQAHHRKDGDAIAQAFRIESGVIAANDAGFLQTADPSPARGGGDRKSTRLKSSHYCATRMPSYV